MIKDVVVHLSLDASRDTMNDFAISVADIFQAHISGIAFIYKPVLLTDDDAAIPDDLIDGLWAESQRRADTLTSAFNEAIRRTSLLSESRTLKSSITGAPSLFAKFARRFDLSIVGQTNPDHPENSHLMIEAALFESGRPVLIMPYVQKTGLTLDRVMVCWDGSRPAARAIADSLPFLARANTIEVVNITSQYVKGEDMSASDIGQHLARHDLNIEIKRIVTSEAVSDVILSRAAESSTDLIIMGGYGHSRLREFVLGGATRGVLAAMTVPTLMAH